MPTERPRLQAYLDPELHNHFLEWKQERGIAKDSEALNQLLAEYFGVSQSPIPNSQFPAMTEQIREMIEEACEFRFREVFSRLPAKPEINARVDEYLNQKFNELNAFRVEFKNEVWLQMKREFAIWNESLQKAVDQIQSLEKRIEILEPEGALLRKLLAESVELASQGQGAPDAGIDGDLEVDTEEELAEDSLVIELPSESLTELGNNALAQRLRISKSVISRRKSEPNFEEWSKEHDPDAIAWRYDRLKQKFIPVT